MKKKNRIITALLAITLAFTSATTIAVLDNNSAITAEAASIKLSATSKSIGYKQSSNLSIKNTGGKTVKWTALNKKIAKITKVSKTKYKVTGVKPGTATIKAKVDGRLYTGIVSDSNGTWFVKDGLVDLTCSGNYYSDGKVYVISKGKVTGTTSDKGCSCNVRSNMHTFEPWYTGYICNGNDYTTADGNEITSQCSRHGYGYHTYSILTLDDFDGTKPTELSSYHCTGCGVVVNLWADDGVNGLTIKKTKAELMEEFREYIIDL